MIKIDDSIPLHRHRTNKNVCVDTTIKLDGNNLIIEHDITCILNFKTLLRYILNKGKLKISVADNIPIYEDNTNNSTNDSKSKPIKGRSKKKSTPETDTSGV